VNEIISVKTTQTELQEAQAEIMKALSVIRQASQIKENEVTQIDLNNLKKELSTEFKNELVNEIRKIYEEIAKISITPVNIAQELHRFSISLKKEIAEQLKSSREEVVNPVFSFHAGNRRISPAIAIKSLAMNFPSMG